MLTFKDAELMLNSSLLFNGPSLIIIGKNGIGKTALIETMEKQFHKTSEFYGTDVDFGGIRQQVQTMVQLKKKNFVIGDMNSIISRGQGISLKAFSLISSYISEGYNASAGFSREGSPALDSKKGYKINFVMAGTPAHMNYLFRESPRYNDFLNRCLIIEVDRNLDEYKPKGFELFAKPIKKYDHNIYRNFKNYKYLGMAPRHQSMMNNVVRQLDAMGTSGLTFIQNNDIRCYEPQDLAGSFNINKYLKPFKPIIDVNYDPTKEV